MANSAAQAGHGPQPPAGPLPPGGARLKVDPRRLRPSSATSSGRLTPAQVSGLPIVEEFSAGGVVVRAPEGEEAGPMAAVITRRNRAGRLEWCLPKGHLEGAETAPQAAIREVREETGIHGQIRAQLGVIDYWFSGDTRRVHKLVHHYLLTMVGGRLTVEEDPDQEAEDAFWVPVATLAQRLSYPNEQRLAQVARQLLQREPELSLPIVDA
ncbi:MAG: NUDIX hydrolase [Promicromonosporaceae bacterium]|nr:NUDIX hydrolase [Promicromonosporaceae bacterium]